MNHPYNQHYHHHHIGVTDRAGAHSNKIDHVDGKKLSRFLATGGPIDTDDVIRAFHTLQADNSFLRAIIRAMVTASDDDRATMAERTLALVPRATMDALQKEYAELREREMTPTMESIIQAVHDTAGRHCEEGGDITLTVSNEEYEMLCDEQRLQAETLFGDRD